MRPRWQENPRIKNISLSVSPEQDTLVNFVLVWSKIFCFWCHYSKQMENHDQKFCRLATKCTFWTPRGWGNTLPTQSTISWLHIFTFYQTSFIVYFCHYKYHLIAKVFFFTLSSIKIITLSWFFVLHCLPKIGNFLVMSLVPMVLITILNFLIYKKIHR